MADKNSIFNLKERMGGTALKPVTPKIEMEQSAPLQNASFEVDKCSRRTALALIGAFPAVAVLQSLGAQPEIVLQRSLTDKVFLNDKGHPAKDYDLLAMQGDKIIIDEDNFGIINGLLTIVVNYRE